MAHANFGCYKTGAIFYYQWPLYKHAVNQIHFLPRLCPNSARVAELDWIEQCFTSPPTQYRLYGRRFLQVTRVAESASADPSSAGLGSPATNSSAPSSKTFPYSWLHVIYMYICFYSMAQRHIT